MYNDAVQGGGASDSVVFSVLRPDATRPLLLVCDHASSAIPARLAELGLPRHEVERHIGWDIGAAAVTQALAERLDATAVLSGVSRLVVDCNRALDDPTLIPAVSDGVIVPGNQALSDAERRARIDAWSRPYHDAIDRELTRLEGGGRAASLVSIHSFTPQMNGTARPWSVGILWNRDPRLALPVMQALRAEGHAVGDNQPYSGRVGAYTMDTHAAAHGRPHITFEIRQDLVGTVQGVHHWADTIFPVLRLALAHPETASHRHY